MSPDDHVHVPASFDDYDDEDQGQVHAVPRILFTGRTGAEVFAKAQRWLDTFDDDVTVIDVSWLYLDGEDQPMALSVYVRIDDAELDGATQP